MATGDFKQSGNNPYAFDAGIVPEHLEQHFDEFKGPDYYTSFFANNFTTTPEIVEPPKEENSPLVNDTCNLEFLEI